MMHVHNKKAYAILPSIGFRSLSRFLAVSLQVTTHASDIFSGILAHLNHITCLVSNPTACMQIFRGNHLFGMVSNCYMGLGLQYFCRLQMIRAVITQ